MLDQTGPNWTKLVQIRPNQTKIDQITCNWHFLLLSPALVALLFCWLLTIFRLGLAFGLSEGGRLARLVTFLTEELEAVPEAAEAAAAEAGWATEAVPEAAEAGLALGAAAEAAVVEDTDEAGLEAELAAAAAAAATLFRLK